MKQTVGTTSVFKAIIAFTLLFAAFLSLAIIYNRAYRLKNESILILEKYEGTTPKALEIVNNFLQNSGYKTKYSCEIGEFGVSDLSRNSYEEVTNTSDKYYYCLSQVFDTGKTITNYHLKLFFKFDLPFFGDLLTFNIVGDTKDIKFYDSKQELK